eukprot:TRINITY_DN782312_c0_g1_i1.p1 TRINITY_DN782312_c0_g1~~TRINITY_DN782312_c0_g1_i1.p1  ORF type:complete len:126 (+),score=30.69 TRINITY_DN782312_c0_g1_i1:122-499(+)
MNSPPLREMMAAELLEFWQSVNRDVQNLDTTHHVDFKTVSDLPLARIKRIMKADEDVRMIRAESPILLAKACELFIMELTLRSHCYSQNANRTDEGLEREDIHNVIKETDVLDFIADLYFNILPA